MVLGLRQDSGLGLWEPRTCAVQCGDAGGYLGVWEVVGKADRGMVNYGFFL